MSDSRAIADDADLSLVLGGPLYQFYVRARLVSAPINLVHRRIAMFVGVGWLPLLLLTLLAGTALHGVHVPFLFDLDTHARLLISIPLLLLAEPIVHRRIGTAIGQFFERELITEEERRRFAEIVHSGLRLRNSAVIEILILGVSYIGGYFLWREEVALQDSTWYATPLADNLRLTTAGYWYAFVSLPIWRFLAARWYFRLWLWYVLLWRVSRLRLQIEALHPDRSGGLGFLGNTVFAFAPVLVAHSVLLAGLIANRIWHEGATLPQFKMEIAGTVVILMALVLLPLVCFCLPLMQAKRKGQREYGVLASRYAREFREKWIEPHTQSEEPWIGSADIQSLADLGNSYESVHRMRSLPFGKGTVVKLAVIIALPILPLTLTMIPLAEIVQKVVQALL